MSWPGARFGARHASMPPPIAPNAEPISAPTAMSVICACHDTSSP